MHFHRSLTGAALLRISFLLILAFGCDGRRQGDNAGSIEREKLLAERLEIERQKTDLERQKREVAEASIRSIQNGLLSRTPSDVVSSQSSNTDSGEREKVAAERLALERQRVELEKEKRETAESAIRARREAEAASQFSDTEYHDLERQITRGKESLGRRLLRGTHPTGTYGNTDDPIVACDSDRRSATATISVNWRGGFSENSYCTTFELTISKHGGLSQLRVNSDSSFVKIDPEFLRATEQSLRSVFR